MSMKQILPRIDKRLEILNLTAAEASRLATGSPDTIRNWRRAVKKGENPGASTSSLNAIAKVLNTNVPWLTTEVGPEEGAATEGAGLAVPLISWVSAGQLAQQETIRDFSDYPPVFAPDLPSGDWFALRVDGPSMNKISPPDSIIFVNRQDQRLVHNACYVIADEAGNATYKRYRQDETPQFQPASYKDIAPPALNGAIQIVGRVGLSMIRM